MSLPPPAANQPFCDVSALEGGYLWFPSDLAITDSGDDPATSVPSLAFLIQHNTKEVKLLFDLGVRSDIENYPPKVVEMTNSGLFRAEVPQDSIQSLAKGGTQPTDIDYVCLSHLHWDHVGNTGPFTRSTFLIHEDSRAHLDPGYPEDPNSYYASNLLPPDRTKYLSVAEWEPVGPFPRALDFFGDGSLFIVDSPGHCAGHVNLLARTSSDGAWIYLAGDSAHHWKLITGEAQIKVGAPWDPNFCFHADKAEAEAHIGRIREVWKMPRVRVLLAHDDPWFKGNKGGPAFWPGKIGAL